jgi:hypothetical protein
MMQLLAASLLLAVSGQLHGILVGAVVIVILILVVAGLIYCIERWISPLPQVVKVIVAVVILLCIVIWAFNIMGVSL